MKPRTFATEARAFRSRTDVSSTPSPPIQRTSSILAALLVAATPALAQQSAPRAMRDSSQKLGAVQITATASGQGEARAVNAVNKGELRQNTAGSSALKALKAPGHQLPERRPVGRVRVVHAHHRPRLSDAADRADL